MARTTSPSDTKPRSPWRALSELSTTAVEPVLVKVAAKANAKVYRKYPVSGIDR